MLAIVFPAAGLLAIAIVGLLLVRSFSPRTRILIDILCFTVASGLLIHWHVSPIITPLKGHPDAAELWLRAVSGLWWLFGARVTVAIFRAVLRHDEQSRRTRLFSDLATGTFYLVTALIVLNSVFFLPITGLLATSGALAIVLGLALQNTLADVFAGIAVGTEGPFRVGDRIKIGDRIEGVVIQLNWRCTRLKTDDDDVAIIPNSSVAKAEIVNRSVPSRRKRISVELHCSNRAVPDRVIELLLQITLLCPAIMQRPAPSAALVRLGPRQNCYSAAFSVDDFEDITTAKSMFLTRAWRQLRQAEITLQDGDTASAHDHPTKLSRRQVLRDTALFESLTDAQLDSLANDIQCSLLEPGETLFAEGSSDASLFIVGTGIIELSREGSEGHQILGCIGASDYVGEIGLLTGAPHAAKAIARTHCAIYRLSKPSFAPVLAQNPKLVSALETAVRRGTDVLQRQVAARASQPAGSKEQFLARIRTFFHISSAGSTKTPD